MCHIDAPAYAPPPDVDRTEVAVPLPSGERMPALLARPAGGRGPAVLLVSDIYGRTPFYVSLAAQLAAAGYVALLPDLFFRQGELPEITRDAWPRTLAFLGRHLAG